MFKNLQKNFGREEKFLFAFMVKVSCSSFSIFKFTIFKTKKKNHWSTYKHLKLSGNMLKIFHQ